MKSIVNISNRGSNIENRTENLKYVSSHRYHWLRVFIEHTVCTIRQLLTDHSCWYRIFYVTYLTFADWLGLFYVTCVTIKIHIYAIINIMYNILIASWLNASQRSRYADLVFDSKGLLCTKV